MVTDTNRVKNTIEGFVLLIQFGKLTKEDVEKLCIDSTEIPLELIDELLVQYLGPKN